MSENLKENKIYNESIKKIKAAEEITLEFWVQLFSKIKNIEIAKLVINEAIKLLKDKDLYSMYMVYLCIFESNEVKNCFKKEGVDGNHINYLIEKYHCYFMGKFYLEDGEYDAALECFNEADDKVEYDDWEKLGCGFLENGELDYAEECFDNIGLDAYTRGEYYLENEEYETAFEYFNEADTELETEKWLTIQEGILREILFNTDYNNDIMDYNDDIMEVIEKLNKKTIDKEDENNFLKKEHLLIKSNFLLGNIDKAKEALEKIENKNYENADYYYYAGRVYLYSDSIKAKEYFTKALPVLDEKFKNFKSVFSNLHNTQGISNNEVNLPIFIPEVHETYEKLIFIYHILKDNNNIFETILSLFKIYSPCKELYTGIAYYYSSIEEGIKILENISEPNREREILKNIYLAKMYFKLDDSKNSIKYCNKLLKIDSNNVEGYILRGNLYSSKYEKEKALLDYNKALEIDINNVEGYILRGNLYYLSKDYEKALEDYNKALEIDINNVVGYKLRGKLYSSKYEKEKALLDYNKALEDYNKALEIDVNNVEVYILRGNLYYLSKDYEKALENYKKALELNALYEGLLNHNIYEIYKSNHIEDIGNTIYCSIDKYLKTLSENKASLIVKMKEIAFEKEEEKEETNSNIKFINMLLKKCLNLEYNIELENIDNELLEIYINVEKILNKLQFKFENNEKLAHYTTKSSSMAILKEGSKIRLKNSIYANDPEEGKFIKDIIWDEGKKKATNNNLNDNNNDGNKETIITEDCIKNNNTYFTCFSKNVNNNKSLPMWVHYADRAEGCILVFNKELFGEDKTSIDKKSDLSISSLYEIMYFTDDDIEYIKNPENSKTIEIEKYLETLKKNKSKLALINLIIELKKLIKNFEDKENIVEEMIGYVSFLFKKSHFKYEEEVRLLKRITNVDDIKIDEKSIPELYVNFDRSIKCKEVILGSKFSDVEVEKMKMFIDYINEKNKELNCTTGLSKSTLKYR